MLEGTELNFAYNTLSMPYGAASDMNEYQDLIAPETKQASASSKAAATAKSTPIQQVQQQQTAPPPSPGGPVYDPNAFAGNFNRAYDQDQRLVAIINEYKKQQQKVYNTRAAEDTYWDKMSAKKKEVLKFLQSALIIIFALSVHFLISHYFNLYLESHDLSYEREMFLRILYPTAIVFVAWNIITFNK